MAKVEASVGRGADNRDADVIALQRLLNANRHRFTLDARLREDGIAGELTYRAIEGFQAQVLGFGNPDGRVDPGGRTLAGLNADPRFEVVPTAPVVASPEVPSGLCFPLVVAAERSYTEGARAFGSGRSGGRLHAGADLYGDVGTEVRAMADGTVQRGLAQFYAGTYSFEVDHGGFIARYCEIADNDLNLAVGAPIQRGQRIGAIGQLRGHQNFMLHIEIYTGQAEGSLTDTNNPPFKRRSDLVDPTPYLDAAVL